MHGQRMVVVAALVSSMMAVAGALMAQPGPPRPPAEVAAAQAALQAGQVDSAIRTLESYFVRNPNATV